MAEYRLTPRAKQDLKDMWQGIAAENEPAADRLLLKLFDRFETATLYPRMGPARPEIGRDVRLLIEGRYVAIYEPASYGILVVAIVNGLRDPNHWLD
ncbi:type II toxin-antitoxin system RelE/ParE family toxin [Rhizobium sp. C4]|uniref:type II toxin-antitoxin system RelE/ParE family toxin n=1 Tax=Rhizobium sp. C4 TaxID=1349800 RepID=UPI001E34F3AE|nr:type II toxin-antitoxin system RelE/ParE family toxin [Rhizobium sp. C4]MCD2174180.1 type II toxin-antitoxin system RelE/ParE family toxin [Rhizobium sp. C4]